MEEKPVNEMIIQKGDSINGVIFNGVTQQGTKLNEYSYEKEEKGSKLTTAKGKLTTANRQS